MIKCDIVSNLRSFANDDSHAMINEKIISEGCTGMDFNSREPTHDLRKPARNELEIHFPEPVSDDASRWRAGLDSITKLPGRCAPQGRGPIQTECRFEL